MAIRHQLPAYSPVSATASLLATAQALHLGEDSRPRLRALLQKEYDAHSVLLCGSGTQALTIAIRESMKCVDAKSSVALPAFSCFDVATAAVGADVRISIYDLDPDTLGPDLKSLERALGEGARVVVVAPLYGIPVDWDELRTLADRYGAILIEDAAQGNGATWKGRMLGTLGEISVLSFGRGKGWTGGNGGAVLMRGSFEVSGEELPDIGVSREAESALTLAAQWALGRPALYGIPASIPGLQLGETVYREPRRETAITRAAAATLLATREDSEREAEMRRVNAERLLAVFTGNAKLRLIRTQSEGSAGYLRFPIRLSQGMTSLGSESDVLSFGIAPSYPRSLADLPRAAERMSRVKRSQSGAQTLVRELITVPTHSYLRERDLAQISASLTTHSHSSIAAPILK
ncbi:MAG: DegT/DnrJ/EryC1/StrS family aminotransferase [Gemmatimonadota bacterium]|nr:DegT/DnrJ/EryC1/StrS family aminotransferase [Gemmatimonadota bacterium]